MLTYFINKSYFTIFSAILTITLIFPQRIYAQTIDNIPASGTMLRLSQSYSPTIIEGITIYPNNPLQFDFIIDIGDDKLQGEDLRKEAEKLISYFMATLTIPEDEMWVNLSPFEKDRIIADGLGNTIMGRDMLAQDYILKQLTASLMYPEDKLGSEFWQRIYKKYQDKFGTTEIPTKMFNKIWIVPEKAVIYANGTNIFVTDSHLKVMLEDDYLALEYHNKNLDIQSDEIDLTKETKQILKEILLPEIEKEVNEGKHFATLRQMYHSMILATWYKNNLKESVLGKIYIDQNKVNGVDVEDKQIKNKIYNQYIKAFEKGVYNYIKEDYDTTTQQLIPRKYFSGGLGMNTIHKVSNKPNFTNVNPQKRSGLKVLAETNLEPLYIDSDNQTTLSYLNQLSMSDVKKLQPSELPDNYPYLVSILDNQGEPTIFQPLESKDEKEKSWTDYINEKITDILSLVEQHKVVGLIGPSRAYKTETFDEYIKEHPDIGIINVQVFAKGEQKDSANFEKELKDIGNPKIIVLDEFFNENQKWMLDKLSDKKIILIFGSRKNNRFKKDIYLKTFSIPSEAVHEVNIKPLNKKQIKEFAVSLLERNSGKTIIPEGILLDHIEYLADLSDKYPITPFVVEVAVNSLENEDFNTKIENEILDNLSGGRLGTILSLEEIKASVSNDSQTSSDLGGIDFNAGNLTLNKQGQVSNINFTDFPIINPNNINGITPVIINITPITNFPVYLSEYETSKN